jgi:pilus assembly protein FimV
VQVADSASGSQSVASGLPNAALQNTSGQGQKESAVATQWLKDNLLVVLTALLAIVAFLIGMRMRRESSRRDDESDDPDVGEVSPAAKTAFEKKLQSIDLNLDSPEASPGEPKKSTH